MLIQTYFRPFNTTTIYFSNTKFKYFSVIYTYNDKFVSSLQVFQLYFINFYSLHCKVVDGNCSVTSHFQSFPSNIPSLFFLFLNNLRKCCCLKMREEAARMLENRENYTFNLLDRRQRGKSCRN